MVNIQILLLAAGASTRMGKTKQLLPWGAKTLVEHQINNLLDTNKSVSVVLGSYAEKVSKIIDDYPIEIYANKEWKSGMGSSIAYGVKKMLEKDPTITCILISLVDQPLLTTVHFKKILEAFHQEKKQIIASTSESRWFGAPVLFHKAYFDELLKLKGDEGAKVIIHKYTDSVELIDGENILIDIDTSNAYQQLLDNFKKTNNNLDK